jgi:predicted DsbA family dithiol-disulfide isomerase
MVRKLRIDVWSDIACPWCYVGKRRLEAAVARMPPGAVEVVWRSFQLDPKAPRVTRAKTSYAERLARKYRSSIEQANATVERMTKVGAADGLSLRFDRVRPTNTFDAHRVLHLARERGVQGAVKERLMRAYFTDGEALGNAKTLSRLSGEAGLDPGEVGRVLAGDTYADAVRADEDEASQLGIHAVPFFGLGGVYGVSGAQPVEVLHGALTQAWAEAPEQGTPEASACGRDRGRE